MFELLPKIVDIYADPEHLKAAKSNFKYFQKKKKEKACFSWLYQCIVLIGLGQ
jgi:adenine specific DNA methylase Mod